MTVNHNYVLAGCRQERCFQARSSIRMALKAIFAIYFVSAFLTSAAAQDARSIIQTSLMKGGDSYLPDPRFLYTIHQTEIELDRFGNTTASTTETFEAFTLYGRPYQELVARNDKALSASEKEAQKYKLDREAAKWRLHPQGNAREDKEKQQRKYMMAQVPDAFHFDLKGSETIRGRRAFIISVTPRAEFHSTNLTASKIFPIVSGTIWIDQETAHWVRIRADLQDTVRFGFFLASVAKGSSVELETVLVDGEVWMPSAFALRYNARIALVKHLHAGQEIRCDNFRRFGATSQLVTTDIRKDK